MKHIERRVLSKLFISSALTISAIAVVANDDWLRSMPEFELTDHLGEIHTMESYSDYDLAVFYVQGVGCPIARIALPNYREVRDEYSGKNIALIRFWPEGQSTWMIFPILKAA